MAFRDDFIWGVAATAYQIEGAAAEDGKGPSVWDMFCRQQGKIFEGQSGDVACDHYHRYPEDVKLMADIGAKAYELSVNWPRVLPEGTGRINQKGLDFYDRLVDALLRCGIEPFVTIYHWEMPYELYCRGGWLNPSSPDWFAEYTSVLVDALSDRVKYWLTQNEPQVFIGIGHQDGYHAPGDTLDFPEVLRAAHHTLLAHGKSVQAIRAKAKRTPLIGLSPVGIMNLPASEKNHDVEAARRATFSVTKKDCWSSTWWLDPIFKGQYPDDGLELFGNAVPKIGADHMATICQPLDFFGVNLYFADRVKAGEDGRPEPDRFYDGFPMSSMRWNITPELLYWGPKFFYERYQLPIFITENGMACHDWVSLDGKVHDPQRIDFIQRHLLQLKRAAEEGVDIGGYFHWSIMDNFEWAEGYRERFGLIYIDFTTQQRVLKDSAFYYREVIASNGGCL
jgi:beta-glucosidase